MAKIMPRYKPMPTLPPIPEHTCWQGRTWQDCASGLARGTCHVAAASAAHFAAGFAAGRIATAPLPQGSADLGLVMGSIASLHGAVQGIGCVRGHASITEVCTALVSLVIAGAGFALGGTIGRFTSDPERCAAIAGVATYATCRLAAMQILIEWRAARRWVRRNANSESFDLNTLV